MARRTSQRPARAASKSAAAKRRAAAAKRRTTTAKRERPSRRVEKPVEERRPRRKPEERPERKRESEFSPVTTQAIRHMQAVRDYMNTVVLEREAETDGLLMATLSHSSVFLYGDVGTSKTRQVHMLSKLLGMRCFDTLLSESTKPEQVFGQVDVPALARGVQRYKIDGYAPTAELVFLDEMFKASAIVLNPLLWLLNERKFRNGDAGIINCPLKIAIAASNEVPTDVDLRPIYDRFVMRFHVHYVKSPRSLDRMIDLNLPSANPTRPPKPMTTEELDRLRALRPKILIPQEVRAILYRVRDQVQRACGVEISDRRVIAATAVMQASALLDWRKSCDASDIAVLAHIFWEKPEQIPKVRAIAISSSSASSGDIVSYEEIAENVWAKAIETGDMETAERKLSDIVDSVREFSSTAGRQVVRTVVGYLTRVRSIIRDRKSFVVTEMISGRATRKSKASGYIFKLSDSTASAWTQPQIRSVGFHFFKKSGYWWREGPHAEKDLERYRRKIAAEVRKSLGVVVRFRRLS